MIDLSEVIEFPFDYRSNKKEGIKMSNFPFGKNQNPAAANKPSFGGNKPNPTAQQQQAAPAKPGFNKPGAAPAAAKPGFGNKPGAAPVQQQAAAPAKPGFGNKPGINKPGAAPVQQQAAAPAKPGFGGNKPGAAPAKPGFGNKPGINKPGAAPVQQQAAAAPAKPGFGNKPGINKPGAAPAAAPAPKVQSVTYQAVTIQDPESENWYWAKESGEFIDWLDESNTQYDESGELIPLEYSEEVEVAAEEPAAPKKRGPKPQAGATAKTTTNKKNWNTVEFGYSLTPSMVKEIVSEYYTNNSETLGFSPESEEQAMTIFMSAFDLLFGKIPEGDEFSFPVDGTIPPVEYLKYYGGIARFYTVPVGEYFRLQPTLSENVSTVIKQNKQPDNPYRTHQFRELVLKITGRTRIVETESKYGYEAVGDDGLTYFVTEDHEQFFLLKKQPTDDSASATSEE